MCPAPLSPKEPVNLPESCSHARDEDSSLVRLLASVAGEVDVAALANKLHGQMGGVVDLLAAGITVFDEEQALATFYPSILIGAGNSPDAKSQSWEYPLADSVWPNLEADPSSLIRVPLLSQNKNEFYKLLHALGVRHEIHLPLRHQDRVFGTLLAGLASPDHISEKTLQYLERQALVITPVLWNCLTESRFSRGDRRRTVLVELSKAINVSLDLETVVNTAINEICRLETGCKPTILLTRDDGKSFHSYGDSSIDNHESGQTKQDVAIDQSAMEWLLQHSQTYISADLNLTCRFPNDKKWREHGIRRYVAAPLYAAGKIIGGFFFGSPTPHPPRKTDIWLYENIALQLGLALDNAITHEKLKQFSVQLKRQNIYLKEEIQSTNDFTEMIGESSAMLRVFEDISHVAETTATVLITGETGVGKELVARAIHAKYASADQPMIKVNCAAIPETMVESELFGHERGAFTSAVESRSGRFELACDGTLLLDEIGELPLSVQAKLLRVLQDGQFERVGGTKTLSSNARIIVATNRDLDKAVKSGAFRADLFYRISVFPIHVPPLRDRREDIPLLVEAFMAQLSKKMGKRIELIDSQSLAYLKERDWPGNVRELRHVIERAIILCDSNCLRIEPATSVLSTPTSGVHNPAPIETLEIMEADHIRRALEQTRGVISGTNGAAALLGLKPSTLRFRMKRLHITRSTG